MAIKDSKKDFNVNKNILIVVFLVIAGVVVLSYTSNIRENANNNGLSERVTGMATIGSLSDIVIAQKVGIGTGNPTELLEVDEGSIYAHGSTMGLGRVVMQLEGYDQFEWYPQNTGLYLFDRTKSAYRLSVLNNGNVGIGTTTPSAKLHVAGDIVVSNLKVSGITNGVFDDCTLRSIGPPIQQTYVSCPFDYIVVGGGGNCYPSTITVSKPFFDAGYSVWKWTLGCISGEYPSEIFAICCPK